LYAILIRTSPACGGATTTSTIRSGSRGANATAALHAIGSPARDMRSRGDQWRRANAKGTFFATTIRRR
jgi:hypothetical protein